MIEFRRREWLASSGKGYGARGWVNTVKSSLDKHGLGEFWANPGRATAMGVKDWKDAVYDAIDTLSDSERANNLAD